MFYKMIFSIKFNLIWETTLFLHFTLYVGLEKNVCQYKNGLAYSSKLSITH